MTMMEASFFQMEDEYIDIELASSYSYSSSSSSSSSLQIFSYSINSPPQARDFEFQVISVSRETEKTMSPADELFYKGKLLPLHLPPRLLMVENILQSSKPNHEQVLSSSAIYEETYLLPFIATTDSATISSADSCRVSFDLNPYECRFDWKVEGTFWFRNLNKIKKSVLGQKLRATGDYLKSLFKKTARSNKKKSMNQAMESAKDGIFNHRKSFSSVIQRVSPSPTSSSSFSFSSNGFSDLQSLKRCSSANAEVERSIEAAIAYCKQTQRLFWSSSKMETGAEIFLN